MKNTCPYNCKAAEDDFGNCPLLMAAYILAGLAMMLNIRLSYSSAPYALIRFQLPENLFSVFVRRMASALELWCLPAFLIADIMELAVKLIIYQLKDSGYGDNSLASKTLKFYAIIVPSIVAQWLNFLTYVILLFVYLAGGDSGRLTTFYWTIAASGFVFGISNVFVFAANFNYIPIYIAGENCFPALTSFIHYLATLMFGNRRKYDSDFLIVFIDILVAIIISLVAAIVWTWAYGICQDAVTECKITKDSAGGNKLTIEYKDAKESDPPKVKEADYTNPPTPPAGTNYNYTVKHTATKNITYTFKLTEQLAGTKDANVTIEYGHIHASGFSGTGAKESLISPLLIVLVGMGLVYAIYPGIAPGMIVPFYLIDKIEMVLLIATIFPPVIIALLQKFKPNWSPKTNYVWHGDEDPKTGLQGWRKYASTHVGGPGDCGSESKDIHAWIWHFFDLVVPIMIILAYLFIYSLHYRDSNISHAIVNQPKMSTALTIIFYMCHEISLAVGFAGMVGNGAEYTVLAQMVGAFLMVFLALYSEGYLIEYKRHDPAHCPTEGMTKWNAFCYWTKKTSKITNHILRYLHEMICLDLPVSITYIVYIM
ncbi:Tpr-related protein family member, putative [Theileria annulata]|uniref:Tpr-related protein family member, putative n=1 Tax=Theileria annulata TaxID=5874 RepID=Q4UI53_THEAN|nr:Tpr-related protein family member, putative [Theileria annulata]CAI73236.1 Tpr-related protein family member, putative [Theileria annulata]|eukprot:XP_953913.1 Tpr-related protein family member, putative [Theileria annulata]